MKTLVFDQFEFDSFASEESLEINIAAKEYGSVNQFRNLSGFVAAAAGMDVVAKLGHARPYEDHASYSSVRAYLKRFAGIDVPDPCPWQMYVLFEDDLEWDGVFATPDTYIRYHWTSTA